MVVAWPSASAWFDAVMDTLSSAEGEAARRAAKIARDTLLRVAYADAKSADQATGRDVATAHQTVADQLGMSWKTVQRARLLLETLGLAATVVEGRYLTSDERAAAARRHGGHQVRAASTRALTMPEGYRSAAPSTSDGADCRSGENVHLPPARGVKSSSHLSKKSPSRASARAGKPTAPRRAASTKPGPARGTRQPRGIEIQRLAAELVRRMPWLIRNGRHIGAVCDVLDRLGVVEGGWTATALLDAIDRFASSARIRVAAIDEQKDPLSYLAWLLRSASPRGSRSPSALLADERRKRLMRQAQEREAEHARRARIAAESERIAAIIESMHAARASSRRSSPRANR